MPDFIPGLQLSEAFYRDVVGPILAAEFPTLAYSAALIGYGSDVLGYDTARSMDHEWGPRLLLFVPEDGFGGLRDRIRAVLGWKLPYTFRGFPTNFGSTEEEGTRALRQTKTRPINHKVEVYTVSGFFRWWLGLDPRATLTAVDWMVLPEQRLLEVTAGKVFHDGLGQLEGIRAKLAYYPHDVWLFLLAAQWRRVGQQEAFVGRTGEVGDELGSRLIAAALVRDLMKLCFLMEKRYTPYCKWFGTAFSRLQCAGIVGPALDSVLAAETWQEREKHLSRAYEIVADLHNGLGITPHIEARVSQFWGRPFQVIHAHRFVSAIDATIADPQVKAIRARFGKVDQLSDNTDVVSYPAVYTKLRAIYETPSDGGL